MWNALFIINERIFVDSYFFDLYHHEPQNLLLWLLSVGQKLDVQLYIYSIKDPDSCMHLNVSFLFIQEFYQTRLPPTCVLEMSLVWPNHSCLRRMASRLQGTCCLRRRSTAANATLQRTRRISPTDSSQCTQTSWILQTLLRSWSRRRKSSRGPKAALHSACWDLVHRASTASCCSSRSRRCRRNWETSATTRWTRVRTNRRRGLKKSPVTQLLVDSNFKNVAIVWQCWSVLPLLVFSSKILFF